MQVLGHPVPGLAFQGTGHERTAQIRFDSAVVQYQSLVCGTHPFAGTDGERIY